MESILRDTIPMHGRMIHGRQRGRLFEQSQQYDVHKKVTLVELQRFFR